MEVELIVLTPWPESLHIILLLWEIKLLLFVALLPGNYCCLYLHKGIFIFDPVTGNKQPFTIIDKEVNERLCLHGNTVNVYRNTPNTILLLGNHVYCYHLKEKQFSIVSEEKGINIIEGSLKAIACDGHSTYLNDIKHIYELDNHSNKS